MAGVFGSGTSGLRTAQVAMDTIAHNIANANTPGYARQTITLSTQVPTLTGNGFVGGGVMPTGIISAVDQYLEGQLTAASSRSSKYSTLESLFGGLQRRVSGDNNGIGVALSGFNSSLSQAATSPTSIPARQLVLTQAEDLVQRFKTTSEFITSERQRAADGIADSATKANDLFKRIAELNDNISKVEPRTSNGTVVEGLMANDLRAQRQVLINKLGEYVEMQTISTPEGETIMVNGVAAVIGSKSSELGVVADPFDPTKRSLTLKTMAGDVFLSASQMGGKMGAYGDYLNNGLENARATLNQLAALFVDSVNSAQTKGTDLQGIAGKDLFGPTPLPSIVRPANTNTGSAAPTLSVDLKTSVASDYRLRYASGEYSLVRLSDNTVLAKNASGPFVADGLTIDIPAAGVPAEGDAWLIRPFGDSANSLKLLQSDPSRLALSTPVGAKQSPLNIGSGVVSPVKVTTLPLDPNLTANVTITFTSATTFDISGPGIGSITGVAFVPEQPIAYNGWEFSIKGAPKSGDVFTVGSSFPNSGDGSNGNEMLEALSGKNFLNGTSTLSDVFGMLQSNVGAKAGLAQSQSESADAMLQIAINEREGFSGVNLDEEAANLARWQQIYQANAKVLSVVQDLFQSLVQSF